MIRGIQDGLDIGVSDSPVLHTGHGVICELDLHVGNLPSFHLEGGPKFITDGPVRGSRILLLPPKSRSVGYPRF